MVRFSSLVHTFSWGMFSSSTNRANASAYCTQKFTKAPWTDFFSLERVDICTVEHASWIVLGCKFLMSSQSLAPQITTTVHRNDKISLTSDATFTVIKTSAEAMDEVGWEGGGVGGKGGGGYLMLHKSPRAATWAILLFHIIIIIHLFIHYVNNEYLCTASWVSPRWFANTWWCGKQNYTLDVIFYTKT